MGSKSILQKAKRSKRHHFSKEEGETHPAGRVLALICSSSLSCWIRMTTCDWPKCKISAVQATGALFDNDRSVQLLSGTVFIAF